MLPGEIYTQPPQQQTRPRLSRVATVHPFWPCQKPRMRHNFEFADANSPVNWFCESLRPRNVRVYDTQVCAPLYGSSRGPWYELRGGVVTKFQPIKTLSRSYVAKLSIKESGLRYYNFLCYEKPEFETSCYIYICPKIKKYNWKLLRRLIQDIVSWEFELIIYFNLVGGNDNRFSCLQEFHIFSELGSTFELRKETNNRASQFLCDADFHCAKCRYIQPKEEREISIKLAWYPIPYVRAKVKLGCDVLAFGSPDTTGTTASVIFRCKSSPVYSWSVIVDREETKSLSTRCISMRSTAARGNSLLRQI